MPLFRNHPRFQCFGRLPLWMLVAGLSVSMGLASKKEASTGSGYLGVAVVPVDAQVATELGLAEAVGVLVRGVQEGSAAEKAGVEVGDVILSLDKTGIQDPHHLGALISEMKPGRHVSLELFRDGRKLTLKCVLSERSVSAPQADNSFGFFPAVIGRGTFPTAALRWRNPSIGFEFEVVDSQLAGYFGVRSGFLVRFVESNSSAQAAGLKAGDVITKIDGKAISSSHDFSAFSVPPDRTERRVELTIVRDHRASVVKLKFSRTYSPYSPFEPQPTSSPQR